MKDHQIECRLFLTLAAFGMFFGVGLGALGAHGLSAHLTTAKMEIYQTAVLYQLIHSLGVMIVGCVQNICTTKKNYMKWAGWSLISGIVLFSGSLYLYIFTESKQFMFITPVGGMAFLAGWLIFGLGMIRNENT